MPELSDYEKYEAEKEHSQFLEEILEARYGEGWDTLTIARAKKERLDEQARPTF